MLIPPAFAQTAAGAAAAPGGFVQGLVGLLPFFLIFLIFWFLVIRPQQNAAKTHRAKLDAVKRGDSVVLGGGIMGRVTKVEDAQVEVEIAPNMRVRAVKAMLADVTPAGGKPAND